MGHAGNRFDLGMIINALILSHLRLPSLWQIEQKDAKETGEATSLCSPKRGPTLMDLDHKMSQHTGFHCGCCFLRILESTSCSYRSTIHL